MDCTGTEWLTEFNVGDSVWVAEEKAAYVLTDLDVSVIRKYQFGGSDMDVMPLIDEWAAQI